MKRGPYGQPKGVKVPEVGGPSGNGTTKKPWIMYLCDECEALLNEFGLQQFAALCIVSEVKVQTSVAETVVGARKSEHEKCQRCWNYWPSVGANAEHADLCERCVRVVEPQRH